MERCFSACKYDKKVSPINSSESYWHTKKFAMEYVKIFEFTAAIRGYNYYKNFFETRVSSSFKLLSRKEQRI